MYLCAVELLLAICIVGIAFKSQRSRKADFFDIPNTTIEQGVIAYLHKWLFTFILYHMKKLNEFQLFLISAGLELVAEAYKKDIAEAKDRGRNHIFSETYVDMFTKETLEAVQSLTKRSKKTK